MTKITDLADWQALQNHQNEIANHHMQDWFFADPLRFHKFSIQVSGLLLDFSKNRISEKTIQLLCNLASSANLSVKIENFFKGYNVNSTENRAALHTALRSSSKEPMYIDNEDVMPIIRNTLDKICNLAEAIRNQEWLGCTGKPISDIVNIGIGGSQLGPLLTTHALKDYAKPNLKCHFISNIDAAHINEVLTEINPETTLFIVSSKSFSTLETITNAHSIKLWLQNQLPEQNINKHFFAITSATHRALQFEILPNQIFPLWDWIGGRYSIWSAIGFPLAIMIGKENFLKFLQGAQEMDEHFRSTPFEKNMPVLLGLIGIWYINFFGANNHAIVPYSHHLNHLRTYLQQADMESNGKSTSQHGITLDYATGPIIWGEQGCNAQHAFHQLLHQGQHLIPVDFILVGTAKKEFSHHHDILVASGLSQAQALMQGKSYETALQELINEGYSQDEAKTLAKHKTFSGNRPSNIIFLESMSPENLGALLALYEHKIFVQGCIWDINSFDQWGVELGKQLLPQILSDLTNNQRELTHDSSTKALIHHYKKIKETL